MKQSYVEADPYRWPYNGDLRPQNTLFLVIDMQTDFCGKGGYVDKMGYDLSLTRAPIQPIQNVLAATREHGFHIMQRAKVTGRIWPIFRKTNGGAAGGSARESEIPDLAGGSSPEANLAGKSFRSLLRSRERQSSTNLARDLSTQRTSTCSCGRKAFRTSFWPA